VKYVFGPVPSRRLGKSLGIDPIPLKTCNWNCVYCQLGRTRPLTNVKREYIPRQDILDEVHETLAVHRPGDIDWITFVGSGEPALHSGLGWLIRKVKSLSNLPVAVITNGTLLYQSELRADLSPADAILPSLDAGNACLYRKINRPWPKLTFDLLQEGMIAFRREYTGQLWVEVMLVKDLNDTVESLQEIAVALKQIRPDQVHLLLPTRPPAESWVQPSDESGVQRALAILGAVANVITPASDSDIKITSVADGDNLEQAILGIVTRHPMYEKELFNVLSTWSTAEVYLTLEKLLSASKVQVIKRYGQSFWSAAISYYEGK
jgi:wyosine [tRNA(Phe)-imidazoG37] synthetase (radical SAM superfamily)